MAIHFLCPYGHRLKVPDHRAGKRGRCPTCQQRVIVPVADPVPSGREKRDWDASPDDQIELEGPCDSSPDWPAPLDSIPSCGNHPAEVAEKIIAPTPAPNANDLKATAPPGSFASQDAAIDAPIEFSFAEEIAEENLAPPAAMPPASTVPARAIETPAPASPAAMTTSPPSVPFEHKAEPPAAVSPATPTIAPALATTTPKATPPAIEIPDPPVDQAATSAAPEPQADVISLGTRPRWVARAQKDSAAAAYRATPQQLETAYWLAAVLLFVIVFAAAPSLGYMQLDQAPVWAQLMLLIAGVQLTYAVWLIILPDWSSVRVGMWVFGVSAAIYAAGTGLFAVSSQSPPPLGLTAAAASASGWCGAIVLVLGALSYACWQVSGNWRRADLAAARRSA